MSGWPIEMRALGAAACGARLWRMGGELHLTVVVKASFALVHDGAATRVPPDEIVRKDRHYERSPARSVEAASDLAPYKPRADVTLIGQAHAPAGAPTRTAAVRLAVFREGPLLDKTLHVYGDRDAPKAAPRPFASMPLVYERTAGGPRVASNPVGVGDFDAGRAPNLVDPRDPRAPACFAPISRYWPIRKQELTAAPAQLAARSPSTDARIAEIPAEMRWPYFQTAPADQQIDFLRGDEWIVLDGMHPTLQRLQSRLPGARGAARVHAVRGGVWSPGQELGLVADSMIIDADRLRCSLLWRGGFVVPGDEPGLALLRVVAGVSTGGAAIAWPPLPSAAAPSSPTSGAPPPLEGDEEPTATLVLDEAAASTLTLSPSAERAVAAQPVSPFRRVEPPPPPPDRLGTTNTLELPVDELVAPAAEPPTPVDEDTALRAPDIPGAPWSRVAARPVPPPLGDDYGTTVFVDLPPPMAPPERQAAAPDQPLGPPLEPGGDDETTTLHRAPPAPAAGGEGGIGGGGTPG